MYCKSKFKKKIVENCAALFGKIKIMLKCSKFHRNFAKYLQEITQNFY